MAGVYAIKKFPEESATDRETMGSRRKIWCRSSREGPEWLFKYPRAGSGEHWAEKIAAEVASRLDIQSAVVELAEYGGEQGSVSASFTPEKLALLHGNELLAVIMDYDINKRHGQSDHSLKNIFRFLTVADATFEMTSPLETVKQQFAGYLVLDALIGNTDRHHQNWGLLGKRTPTGFRVSLAPSFDHASSLGRDISDEVRARRVREGTVGQYSEKARGRVFLADSARYGPSPLNLVRRAAAEHLELFRVPLVRVRDRRSRFEGIVRRVPDDWMSPTAKDFTVALLDYNATELEKCLK